MLGDSDRLVVALDALLENAVLRTPEPGDHIEVSVRLDDGRAVIAVTDSGCGIPPTDLDRIFGRFARAEPYRSRDAGGFGLGLPIVQAIAEAHHGSVRVRSGSGHGATFELVIPAVPRGQPGARVLTIHRSAVRPWVERGGCPVGNHWSLVVPVPEADLTEEERQFAREHRDDPHPLTQTRQK